ncbi:DUF3515 domain-containing protein [Skermania sp. ID1734]|uniref:DUF3515 domain-containing protein n=1 Tax=Skermania sp. ID1734 TaxID=2597516 RepID=UPI00117FAFDD|nr:DUF3515 domain-containing protein [Skermania sp. ID1734]TSE01041.1 DUF3515 domain-containing protein [Skermania sp. ID1734]
MSDSPTHHRHPALIATAVALPVALVVGIIVAAVLANRIPAREPIALGSVPAPAANGPDCAKVLGALPNTIGDYSGAKLAFPAPAGAKAWEKSSGGDPIVLRCGLDRPAEFTVGAAITQVDGVQWFEVSGKSQGLNSATWYAVDRGVYIALTVPDGTGPTPLQAVSDAISAALPARPIDPAPLPK